MLNSYLDISFDVLHAPSDHRYAGGKDIRSVNLGPIVLFSNYKLTITSENYLEDISHAHIVSSMLKLIPCANNTDDQSIDFDRDRNRRQGEFK